MHWSVTTIHMNWSFATINGLVCYCLKYIGLLQPPMDGSVQPYMYVTTINGLVCYNHQSLLLLQPPITCSVTAISGLEELVLIYPAFGDFEATLFNVASATWERSLQTKEVNEQLDETISKFLILLSPYFLLRAAHKTLEWLIYK